MMVVFRAIYQDMKRCLAMNRTRNKINVQVSKLAVNGFRIRRTLCPCLINNVMIFVNVRRNGKNLGRTIHSKVFRRSRPIYVGLMRTKLTSRLNGILLITRSKVFGTNISRDITITLRALICSLRGASTLFNESVLRMSFRRFLTGGAFRFKRKSENGMTINYLLGTIFDYYGLFFILILRNECRSYNTKSARRVRSHRRYFLGNLLIMRN